jgi:hypothetical protein
MWILWRQIFSIKWYERACLIISWENKNIHMWHLQLNFFLKKKHGSIETVHEELNVKFVNKNFVQKWKMNIHLKNVHSLSNERIDVNLEDVFK